MDEKKPVDIPPPPRRLPDEVRAQLKRNVLMPRLFGAIWLATGFAMLVVFLLISHPFADEAIRRNHERAVGSVTAVSRQGERNPYRVAYTFVASDGREHAGRSFIGRRPLLKPDEHVTVQYVPDRPRWSRIEGMRYAVLTPAMYLLPLCFLVGGAAVWFTGVAKLARLRRLYEQGVATTGTVLGERWHKMMRMNLGFRKAPRYLYELRYRFTDDYGRERDAVQRTFTEAGSLHFAEGDTVTVLFDRANPARSVAVDVLKIEFTTDPHR